MTYHPDSPSPGLWHRFRPNSGSGNTSLLFWLTIFGVGCVTLLIVTWGASALLAKKGSEKLLRVDLLFPKLKNVHAERPLRTSETELPKDRQKPGAMPLPAVIEQPRPTAEPALQLIEKVELMPAATCLDPAIYLHPCHSPRGDSPMIRNWKTMTMVSLLSAAAVVVTPQPALLHAQDDAKELEKLNKSLTEILTRIDKLEKKKVTIDQEALNEVIDSAIKKSLTKSLEALRTDISSLQQDLVKQQLHNQKQTADIKNLTAELDSMRKSLATNGGADKALIEDFRNTMKTLNETIAKLGPTKQRDSMSPPINGTHGRVMIVNLYNEDLLFLINNAPHRVPAGSSKLLEVPSGTLHYRVHSNRWGPLSNQTTTLTAGDTFTLTAAHQK